MSDNNKKSHNFHLVDPSIWPIFSSFAALVLAFGAVYYMHSKSMWLLLIGLALTLYSMFMWFRDVVGLCLLEERDERVDHRPVLPSCEVSDHEVGEFRFLEQQPQRGEHTVAGHEVRLLPEEPQRHDRCVGLGERHLAWFSVGG